MPTLPSSDISSGGGGSSSAQTVQTLPGNANTGSLISQLNPSWKKHVPIDTQNLVLWLNPSEQTYSDASITTPATTQGAVIQSAQDQAGNANTFANSTNANSPTLQLGVNGIGGQPALQFCDNQQAPAVGYVIGTSTGPLVTAMQKSCTFYMVAQLPLPNSQAFESTLVLAKFGGSNRFVGFASGMTFQAASQVGNAASLFGNQLAVFSFAYDGVNMVTRMNNKEVSAPATAALFSDSAGDLIVGGLTNNASTSFSSLAKVAHCLVYSDTHTKAQRDAIVAQLMDVCGIQQTRQVIIGGNSIEIGTAGYNSTWPNNLANMLDATQYNTASNGFVGSGQHEYIIVNNSVAAQTTSQQAASFGSLSTGSAFYGAANGWTTGAATGSPTTTVIPCSASAWGNIVGQTIMFTSGANAGMGCVIASNTAISITVVGPGFAVAPAAADAFVVWNSTMNVQKDIYIAHEITNDMLANGPTDGPGANGGNALTCKAYLRYVNWCQAAKAAGFNVIVGTYAQRVTQGTNYAGASFALAEADRVAINAALTANWQSFGAGFVDYTLDTRFAAYNTNTWWLDGIHPTNAGAKIIAQYYAQAIRTLNGQY